MNLAEVEVTNLRGFYGARLRLDRKRTVLVGPNNSGKTSILLLLDWILNQAPDEVLKGERSLTEKERNLLLPARSARHRARRLKLRIRVSNGKKHKKYKCDDDTKEARLIFGYRVSRQRAALRLLPAGREQPAKGRNFETEESALELLHELRKNIQFVHIPSFRDPGSDRFRTTLNDMYHARLDERALHSGKRGATTEYREMGEALDTLNEMVDRLVQPFWEDIKPALPTGLADKGQIDFTATRRDLVNWMTENLDLRVSTDERDEDKVGLSSVGSGLQSLFDLVVHSEGINHSKVSTILAVEEPEAFLHPAAQRTIAREVLDQDDDTRVIVTTHSPIIVDETQAHDVVITKLHKFYEQVNLEEDKRKEINTAFMTGAGAEAVFSHSLLFVEGEGDQLFFEALRRRLAKVDESGCLDKIHVIEVGSNTSFAPWIRLFNSYRLGNERPIQWLVVPDADSGTEAMDAFNDAGITVPQVIRDEIREMNQACGNGEEQKWEEQASKVNNLCSDKGLRLRFLSRELEDTMLKDAQPNFVQKVSSRVGAGAENKTELVRWLGNNKKPWMRGFIGAKIPVGSVSKNVENVLVPWISGAMKGGDPCSLLNKWKGLQE